MHACIVHAEIGVYVYAASATSADARVDLKGATAMVNGVSLILFE